LSRWNLLCPNTAAAELRQQWRQKRYFRGSIQKSWTICDSKVLPIQVCSVGAAIYLISINDPPHLFPDFNLILTRFWPKNRVLSIESMWWIHRVFPAPHDFLKDFWCFPLSHEMSWVESSNYALLPKISDWRFVPRFIAHILILDYAESLLCARFLVKNRASLWQTHLISVKRLKYAGGRTLVSLNAYDPTVLRVTRD
jgi:hypothetical protein